jgi:hypothetical protein
MLGLSDQVLKTVVIGFDSSVETFLAIGVSTCLTLIFIQIRGRVKTERVFPGLSVLRKNNKMEVLYPEK